jgi:hypothetical protein
MERRNAEVELQHYQPGGTYNCGTTSLRAAQQAGVEEEANR